MEIGIRQTLAMQGFERVERVVYPKANPVIVLPYGFAVVVRL